MTEEPGGPPFQVVTNGLTRALLQQLARRARYRGEAAEFMAALRELTERLQLRPREAGASKIQGWALMAVWPSSSSTPQLVMKNAFWSDAGRRPRPR